MRSEKGKLSENANQNTMVLIQVCMVTAMNLNGLHRVGFTIYCVTAHQTTVSSHCSYNFCAYAIEITGKFDRLHMGTAVVLMLTVLHT